MPWRPDEYEVEYADELAFEAKLDEFPQRDAQRLAVYLKRMSRGQYHDTKGNVKALQGRAAKTVGLHELRANFKPPYRVYFGYRGGKVIIATVGTKHTQDRDIEHASAILGDWDRRQ